MNGRNTPYNTIALYVLLLAAFLVAGCKQSPDVMSDEDAELAPSVVAG